MCLLVGEARSRASRFHVRILDSANGRCDLTSGGEFHRCPDLRGCVSDHFCEEPLGPGGGLVRRRFRRSLAFRDLRGRPAIYADAKALCRWRLCKCPCRFLPPAYRPWRLLQRSGETAGTCVLFHRVGDRGSFHL